MFRNIFYQTRLISIVSIPIKVVVVVLLTSTILGQEVAERVLEAFYVRAGYILGILFVLLIKKYYVLSYFILFYFVLSYFI